MDLLVLPGLLQVRSVGDVDGLGRADQMLARFGVRISGNAFFISLWNTLESISFN